MNQLEFKRVFDFIEEEMIATNLSNEGIKEALERYKEWEKENDLGKITGTIQEAKDYLNENYKKGCNCPVCDSTVKLYKRKLNSGMARTLIEMYKCGDEFTHVKNRLRENKLPNTHDFTLLRHWELIIAPDEDCEGQASGLWKITEKGQKFCRGEIVVNRHVKILLNDVRGFSDEKTTIQDSLGDGFNYEELMRGI